MKYIKNTYWLTPHGALRKAALISESAFAKACGLSRLTIRHIVARAPNVTVDSLMKAASGLERQLILLLCSDHEFNSEYTTVAVSQKILQDGFESWQSHFFEMVDEYRKTQDPRLLLLSPVNKLSPRLKALLASLVLSLCDESDIDPPPWALKPYFLETPWFPSETESLKAMACLESPLWFRRNNIFVLGNFMERA